MCASQRVKKMRESCSLPTCSQKTGECMHCSCDGRCGQHEKGMCGVRREGSGRSCKIAGCSRDETCKHSTRAACYQCRNMVTSNSRALKGKRSIDSISPRSLKKRKVVSQSSFDQQSEVDNTVSSSLLSEGLVNSLPVKSLSLYPAWSSRRHICNLIVMVEGTQFNLHKSPMLSESLFLNCKAQEICDMYPVSIPIISLEGFPGGAQVFEQLCIYAYTGRIAFNSSSFPLVYSGIQYAKMSVPLQVKAQGYLNDVLNSGSVHDLLEILSKAIEARSNKPIHGEFDMILSLCSDAIADLYPFDPDIMTQLLKLSCDSFMEVTQRILTRKAFNPDALLLDHEDYTKGKHRVVEDMTGFLENVSISKQEQAEHDGIVHDGIVKLSISPVDDIPLLYFSSVDSDLLSEMFIL